MLNKEQEVQGSDTTKMRIAEKASKKIFKSTKQNKKWPF